MRVESGLLGEIEGELGLLEKEVPEVFWEGIINAHEDCKEMVHELVYGGFSDVARCTSGGTSW